MKQFEYTFYSDLLEKGRVLSSDVPKKIKKSNSFKQLLGGNVIVHEKVGRGFNFVVKNKEGLGAFFTNRFPNSDDNIISKSSNVRKFRDSKARKVKLPPMFFLRGFDKINLNNEIIDLGYYTNSFGLFAVSSVVIDCKKLCIVENLASFLSAEKLLGEKYTYLYKVYGRIGKDSIKDIKADEILVFVDYDFSGLDEYLRIKEVFEYANLYVPANLERSFEGYSKTINGDQKQSNRVKNSNLAEVIRIRELVARNSSILEQELFDA